MKAFVHAALLCAAASSFAHAADSFAKHSAAPKKLAATAKKEAPVEQAPLKWSLSTVENGAKLRISYTIHNSGAQRIYVCDKLIVPRPGNKFARTDAPVVMNGEPGIVRVILGAVSSNMPSARIYTPTFRALDPGKSMDGTIDLALPLKAWHPVGGASPILPDAQKLSFEVQFIEGEPPKWITEPSDDAEAIKVPEGAIKKMLSTAPQAIFGR